MGSKTDILVKLVLVFFISLLSFAVGTFVGKKFSDNQHQLAELEGAKPGHGEKGHEGRGVASTKEDHSKSEVAHKEEMSEEEIAKLAEEFVADEPNSENEEHGSSSHHESHAKESHAKENHAKDASSKETKNTHSTEKSHETQEKHVAEKTLEGHGKSVDVHALEEQQTADSRGGNSHSKVSKGESQKHEAVKRIPSSLPENTIQFNVGKFTVQVASYVSEDEAIKYTTDLKKKGFSAYYLSAEVNGKTWYRVSVGQFTTLEEAKNFRKELIEKAHLESAIVQKITR